jgi:C1A family cysteine protease
MADGDRTVKEIAAAIEREGLPWTAAPNELTALSAAERRGYLGLIVTEDERQQLAAAKDRVAVDERARLAVGAPAAFDWRNVGGQDYVTPVKNQGGCGSCVSFCTCAVIESAVRIKLGNPNYAIDLSEGFLQFCGGGSCGGWGLTSGLDAAKSMGVTDEACMPYNAPPDMNCTASRCSDWQNRLTKISNYTGYATADARKTALATIGPLLAGMAVYNDFFGYSSGVYVKSSSTSLAGYHCITVVGYDDNQQCWILKNSWGPGWGDGGFVRVRYNQPQLLIDTDWMFYSVVPVIQAAWHVNIAVSQVYASRDAQNGWAYLAGLGWRRIQPGAPDGVTNMLALFAEAVAKGRPVTVYADGTYVYQAYL